MSDGQARDRVDLAALLIAAIEERREELNASDLADGLAGSVTLDVNLPVRRIQVSWHAIHRLPPFKVDAA